jgi:hypothetical protein
MKLRKRLESMQRTRVKILAHACGEFNIVAINKKAYYAWRGAFLEHIRQSSKLHYSGRKR